MHWILNMNVAIFCQSMLLITVWCHLQIPSADRTACLRWLLSHQGLKNNGVAQMRLFLHQAHGQHIPKYVCVKVIILVLV